MNFARFSCFLLGGGYSAKITPPWSLLGFAGPDTAL
jgi:hypothetical protein